MSTPAVVGAVSVSVPPGPKYQVRAVVPGTGSDEKSCSNAAYGSPAFAVAGGPLPAPLSNSTRTDGSALNAASARS